ncbi:hypothetical protein T10_704 [Trichinella papuae]|uniref:Uncharacterized protein n=1 Tax=Trichinella papuae TaxID=268474 RepID=A0A0V1M6P8_9BILA|nr:hypothetical protein T10_2958 [Trichinella papuae]KRZ67595.1 hypothetical protein T10_704 [Trichinella papuae]
MCPFAVSAAGQCHKKYLKVESPLALLVSFPGGKFGGSLLYARTLICGVFRTKSTIVLPIECCALLIDLTEFPQAGSGPDFITFVLISFGDKILQKYAYQSTSTLLSSLQVATCAVQLLNKTKMAIASASLISMNFEQWIFWRLTAFSLEIMIMKKKSVSCVSLVCSKKSGSVFTNYAAASAALSTKRTPKNNA